MIKMNAKLKGYIYGIIAAISYGTNPLGSLFLYEEGINTNSVLFYRFSLAAVLLAGLMLIQKKAFFVSFHYMNAGIASTLLFVYPVMVAVIMAIYFKEKLSFVTVLSILLALGGIGLLYKGDKDSALSTIGVLLVMLSSLTYALYIRPSATAYHSLYMDARHYAGIGTYSYIFGPYGNGNA